MDNEEEDKMDVFYELDTIVNDACGVDTNEHVYNQNHVFVISSDAKKRSPNFSPQISIMVT